jgi:predicted DNA-binding protein (MmcQ/YjbR family)
MNLEEFRDYCLSRNGAVEDTPFGPETLVFKVMDKLFALTGINDDPITANLKCDPEWAVELRDQYKSINPGWHMSKKHWNTIALESELDDRFICELIDHSYELVVKGLSAAQKKKLFDNETI